MRVAANPLQIDEHELLKLLPLFQRVCKVAGSRHLIEEAQARLQEREPLAAIATDDAIFEWLNEALSFQGIGDSVAAHYIETHGSVSAAGVRTALHQQPACPKLAGYWTFEDCRYHTGSHTCSEPEHIAACPLPNHDLRNGRLNQTAYALFLFCRDVARGDFVGWLDHRLASVAPDCPDRSTALGNAILEALAHVHGVSNKVLSMALSELLLASGSERPLWLETGSGMTAIDSLVHNWMHRTGVLARLGCDHLYGDHCYGQRGCAEIIRSMSALIDARRYNPDYPANFPRFVQKAIWWFCAQAGLDICNGNRIDDRAPCDLADCPLGDLCQRRILHRQKPVSRDFLMPSHVFGCADLSWRRRSLRASR